MTTAPDSSPLDDSTADEPRPADSWDEPDDTTGSYALEARGALRRVAGLSTELADVTEVEYRQLRLERVVLVGVWTEGTVRVDVPGGRLTVTVRPETTVLTGPAVLVADGTLRAEWLGA